MSCHLAQERFWFKSVLCYAKQGKEEFERQQKELLEKENIMKQSKMELEHHQVRLLGRNNNFKMWCSLHLRSNGQVKQERPFP